LTQGPGDFFELLLSVFITVSLSGFLRVMPSVVRMSASGVGVVGGLLHVAHPRDVAASP
jgi:hypothetical protein